MISPEGYIHLSEEFPPEARIIVMKFGGTSVGSVHAIEQTSSIIGHTLRTHPCCLVVVVSAIRGVTDTLVTISQNIASNERNINSLLVEDLFSLHTNVVSELELPLTIHEPLTLDLQHHFYLLRAQLASPTHTPELHDLILSFGERLNARIVAAKLQADGTPSEAVNATTFLETDDHFGDAHPNFQQTAIYARRALYPCLRSNITPVVTGFIGATRDNRITTFGRGGSDYTASILGNVLNAQEVWIWTDVDGIYSADPRKNPAAEFLREITQEDAHRLAQAGAKVLHPKTIEPLMGKDILLRIKNTFRPDFPGTTIVRSRSDR